jgi:dolichyl-phosphate beta-glucosyltransferase
MFLQCRCNRSFHLGTRSPFPNILDAPSLLLSVVIPAYNEEDRLPVMLKECVDYLASKFPKDYEIILVDDGSKDKTTKVGLVILNLFE